MYGLIDIATMKHKPPGSRSVAWYLGRKLRRTRLRRWTFTGFLLCFAVHDPRPPTDREIEEGLRLAEEFGLLDSQRNESLAQGQETG